MKQPIPFGNYYLMDLIAKGGMAEVFKAKYLGPEGFSKIVAVKRILPELAEEQDFIQMFIDEAKIASQLSHANITQILQLGEAQGSYFIAMEFIQGKDFRTVYERSRRDDGVLVSPQMAAFVLASVCDGIDYAHRRCGQNGNHLGIIHRDVSPQNIIASFDGDVKLIDFGIAKAQDKLVKTEAGILKGKYCYMSPEQVRGNDLDHRSDIFGLGVVLHEILTRQRLFLGTNDLKTLENVLRKDIPPPSTINPTIPPELDRIVMRALSRNLGARYQYASEMREDLMRFLYSFDSVFGRRDLATYMHSVFASDLEKEMKRQASYEPFFAALPNTPLPSAVEQISQLQSEPSHELVAHPTVSLPPESTGAVTGGYAAPADYNQIDPLRGDVTSYSGPHPNPNSVQPAQVQSAYAHSHSDSQGFSSSPHYPPQHHIPTAPPPAGPAPSFATPPSFSTPPASQGPSFMFPYGSDVEDDDDDEMTVRHTSEQKAQLLGLSEQQHYPASGDLSAHQMGWGNSQNASSTELPQTALLSSSQLLGSAPVQSYDYLQPSEISQSGASIRPPQPMTVDLPSHQAAAVLQGAMDENGPETIVQPVVESDVEHAVQPGTSRLQTWVIILSVFAFCLTLGLAGVYGFRCQLFDVCKPTADPVQSTGVYTLVFEHPANDVLVTVNGKALPAKQVKRLSSKRIQLSFVKPGDFLLRIQKPGCRVMKNQIRIVLDREIETPPLKMFCPNSVPAIPRMKQPHRLAPPKLKPGK